MPLSAHEFERRLIFYASPTLTKLKVACIYNLNDLDDLEECIQYYNELLNKKDIYLSWSNRNYRSYFFINKIYPTIWNKNGNILFDISFNICSM